MSLILALGLLIQEDLSSWIDRLKSDDIQEREEAIQYLRRCGPAVIECLEKTRDAAQEPEVRGLLTSIITQIQRDAELAKVLGETKQITLAGDERTAGDLLKELATGLGEPVESRGLDLERRVHLNLKDATLWQALDAFAKAVGCRYEYGEKVLFLPGPALQFPTVYTDQFRISLANIHHLLKRSIHGPQDIVMATLCLQYQRNVHPDLNSRPQDWERLSAVSITDAKGRNVRTKHFGTPCGSFGNEKDYCLMKDFYIEPDAEPPLTIVGSASLSFAVGEKQTVLSVAEKGLDVRSGDVSMCFVDLMTLGTSTYLGLTLSAPDRRMRPIGGGGGFTLEVPREGDVRITRVRVLDDADHEYEAEFVNSHSRKGARDVEFKTNARHPTKIIVYWAPTLHRVEIPFRLEGIPIPR